MGQSRLGPPWKKLFNVCNNKFKFKICTRLHVLSELLLQLFCLKLPKWEMSQPPTLFDCSRAPESLGKEYIQIK